MTSPAPANLVHQLSTTTGDGNLAMTAVNGKRTFNAAFGGDTFVYFAANRDADEHEWGTGHEDAGELVRDTVLGGSNGTSPVEFSAGTKDITNDVPAEDQYYVGKSETLDSIDLIVAELAMSVADLMNTSMFLGATGNRFADSFETLTYVDTGGSTNLNTGTAGLLKPTATGGTLTGTPIGTLTGGGGLAAAFNGNTNQADSASAFLGGTGAAYIGLTLSAASAVTQVDTYGGNNSGYNGLNVSTTLELYGKTGSAPSSGTNGTLLGSTTFTDTSTTSAKTITNANSPGTVYDHVWVRITGHDNAIMAEMVFAGALVANDMVAKSNALTAAAAPSMMKVVALVNEVDAITPDTDLIFAVSRDGGTTWTDAVMTDRHTSGSVHVYESAPIDVSGQPGGTSVKWRATTDNNKMVEIHGVYIYWT